MTAEFPANLELKLANPELGKYIQVAEPMPEVEFQERANYCRSTLAVFAGSASRGYISRITAGAREQIKKTQFARPALHVIRVQAASLNFQDSDHVTPLEFGNLAALTVPIELGQDGIFRRRQPDPRASRFSQRAGNAARELLAHEWFFRKDEEIKLEKGTKMNEVE
jgi:hypothetical protein